MLDWSLWFMPGKRSGEGPITVRGAEQNNLKNIDVTIPDNQLTVITGVSGSGKSSLAFDTLYAEGQRRYVEQLGADIIMAFDECTPYPLTRAEARESMLRSMRWAQRSRSAHTNQRQALFGIMQGSVYTDLRRESLGRLNYLPVWLAVKVWLKIGLPFFSTSKVISSVVLPVFCKSPSRRTVPLNGSITCRSRRPANVKSLEAWY